ncbi:MSMEG_1061 family FMN-dependent PPOX-type flavoprotein [Roseivivax isoporae]|uniref:Pyridoxamine 5'-phosphate oxidase n=1 Tax=Roseivivax isoporae LMG 25204 TaxID=1449351 RepID=X7FB75_9RHOB|nr:MSMEG_1061 family FMN-dependent PPOX-type flavoprotein [Roseivivax isoporae]ETX29968.1 pyridoxamine 5'-phosphate oxidase [Roseivivax isoporae LMG 25204]
MRRIDDIATLEGLYGAPVPASLSKVARRIGPEHGRWIAASRFCVLSTVGPGGTDGSPRGDDGPVAEVADPRTVLIPDWSGNNRLDSLRNIVADGRVSLMFMVSGSTAVVRVNGRAFLTDDADLRARFDRNGRLPATVIVVEVGEVYVQCAKAVLRSGIWGRDDSADLPSPGSLIREAADGAFDAEDYDRDYAERARPRMW